VIAVLLCSELVDDRAIGPEIGRADRPVATVVTAEMSLDINGLMRAVKCAEPEMNDADGRGLGSVSRRALLDLGHCQA
jgi:hypothetical protein